MEENLDDAMFDLNSILDVPDQHPMCDSDLPWISSDNLLENSIKPNQTFTITPSYNYSSSSPPVLASSINQLTTILDFTKDSVSYCKKTDDIIDAALAMERNEAGKVRRAPVVRDRWQAEEHVVAERKRRAKMGQLFISLSKVLPGIKKLDKASLLEDAINHTKALQKRIQSLEKELQASVDNPKPSTRREEGVSKSPQGMTVRISGRSVLIRIHCKKHEGFMKRIHMEMERMNLSVADLRIMPFGANLFLDITILAQMQDDVFCSTKDIVKQLEKAFFIQ